MAHLASVYSASLRGRILALSLGALLLGFAPPARAVQTQNFNGGTDSPPFNKVDPVAICASQPLGTFATWSYPAHAGGLAYRLQADATLVGSGICGPSRAISSAVTEGYSADFVASVDYVTWSTVNAGAGIAVLDSSSNGYTFVHSPGAPESMVLARVVAGAPPTVTPVASQLVSLSTSNDYRLVLTRTGTLIEGRIYDLAAPTTLVVPVLSYTETVGGFPPAIQGANLVVQGNLYTDLPDATFDNFFSNLGALDADSDGLNDKDELVTHGTDPNDSDSDGDGLSDGDEVLTHGTDPLDTDTDDDGFSDWREVSPARVFTSQAIFSGSTVDNSDAACISEAASNGLGSDFRAWFSTSIQDARDLIADQAYYLPSGSLVATSLADLTDGTIATPIDERADGSPRSAPNNWVWTGTGQDGTAKLSCTDWTTTSGFGWIGRHDLSTFRWTDSASLTCSAFLPVYCFDGLAPGTDPTLADTDGDDFEDGEEVPIGTDPVDPTDFPSVTAAPSLVTTSYWGGATDGKPAHLINGSGLSGTGPIQDQTHDNHVNAATMWHAGDVDGGLGGPVGNPPPVASQAIVFDLSAHTNLGGAYVWNHNQLNNTGRGVDQFEILVSSGTNPLTASFASVGTFQLAQAGGGPAEPAQFVPFSAQGVRLVKFANLSAHSGQTNDFVGLSEVRFVTPRATLVPALSPGALGLLASLLVGIAVVFLRARRSSA